VHRSYCFLSFIFITPRTETNERITTESPGQLLPHDSPQRALCWSIIGPVSTPERFHRNRIRRIEHGVPSLRTRIRAETSMPG
jgi:hypothetical protein